MLGAVAATTSWAPIGEDPQALSIPSTLVVLFSRPLWYANAIHFQTEVTDTLAALPEKPTVFVLDVIGMNDIDFTGTRALTDVLDVLAADHIIFRVARASTDLRKALSRSGLLKRIGDDAFFSTVDEAVSGSST